MTDVPSTPEEPAEKGVFAGLFDIMFEQFITPTLLSVAYVVVLIVTGIAVVVGVAGSAWQGSVPGVLLSIVGAGLSLLLIRVVFEAAALFFSMADDIRELRRRGAGF